MMRTRMVLSFLLMATALVTWTSLSSVLGVLRTTTPKKLVEKLSHGNALAASRHRILVGHHMTPPPTAEREYVFTRNISLSSVDSQKAGFGNSTRLRASSRKGETIHAPALDQKETKTSNSSSWKERLECKPRRTAVGMAKLFGSKFNESLEPFLTQATSQYSSTVQYPPPFGLKGAEHIARPLVQKLSEGLSDMIERLPCRRCVVVGNGGLLKNSQAGALIDRHDVVIRLNMAPVKGYESDVGSKTSMRLVYPESSSLSADEYTAGWLLVVIPFKLLDLQWTDRIVEGRNISDMKGFWQPIAKSVPKSRNEIRVSNPQIISELAADLIGFDIGSGEMKKNVPTTGAVAIAMALRICDEVSVAGFGYSKLQPNDPVHYYGDKLTMSNVMSSATHNISPERKFLRLLVEHGIILDVTQGLL